MSRLVNASAQVLKFGVGWDGKAAWPLLFRSRGGDRAGRRRRKGSW